MQDVKDMLNIYWLRYVVLYVTCIYLAALNWVPSDLTQLQLFAIVACYRADSASVIGCVG